MVNRPKSLAKIPSLTLLNLSCSSKQTKKSWFVQWHMDVLVQLKLKLSSITERKMLTNMVNLLDLLKIVFIHFILHLKYAAR